MKEKRETQYHMIEYDRGLPVNGGSLQWPERMLLGYEYAADEEIVYVKQSQPFAFPCILAQPPVLLLGEELSKVILKAAPDTARKRVAIMNLEQQRHSFYNWVNLPKAMCANPERALIQGGQIMGMTADLRGLEEAPIFSISYFPAQLVIVRLDIAEALLRAGIYGLSVRPIQITEGEM